MNQHLKAYIVVKAPDDKFEIWTQMEYYEYINGAVKVGGASAYRVVTHFNADENLLKGAEQPDPRDQEIERLRKALTKSLEWIADTGIKNVNLEDKKGMALYHIKWLAINALEGK